MSKVLIIAEAGVNHNGDIELAKQLIEVAKESGADYMKFQTFKTELAIARYTPKAEYQTKNVGEGNMFDMVKKLELSYDDFLALKSHCEKLGIGLMSTAFDLPSIAFLNDHQGIFKVPSG